MAEALYSHMPAHSRFFYSFSLSNYTVAFPFSRALASFILPLHVLIAAHFLTQGRSSVCARLSRATQNVDSTERNNKW